MGFGHRFWPRFAMPNLLYEDESAFRSRVSYVQVAPAPHHEP
jgi:hypothetical protein